MQSGPLATALVFGASLALVASWGVLRKTEIQFCLLFERTVDADCILGIDAVLAFMSCRHRDA